MQWLKVFAVLFGLAVLSGCAGMGIVATSDPLAKLNDSEDLFERQGRPLPAERLIREAMVIYEERDDAHGLGNANRQYGDLLRSPAVLKWGTREFALYDLDRNALTFYRHLIGVEKEGQPVA